LLRRSIAPPSPAAPTGGAATACVGGANHLRLPASVGAVRGIMGELDQQHLSTVERIHAAGLNCRAGTWRKAPNTTRVPAAAPMQALWVGRAAVHAGCCEASREAAEPATIVNFMAACEETRWSLGKVPGGKG
jgi:hypothetical protein